MNCQNSSENNYEYHRNTYCASGLKVIAVVLCMTGTVFGLDFAVTTTFDRSFSDKWHHFPEGATPAMAGRDTTYPHIPLQLYVSFPDYARNIMGFADLAWSYTISDADGTIIERKPAVTAFRGVIEPDAGTVVSQQAADIVFTRLNRPGLYTLEVVAEDRISGTRKALTKQIVLSPLPKARPERFDVRSFNIWVHNYCRAPDPARAVSAFVWFVNSESSDDERILWPVLYFFQSLFYNNPPLIDALMSDFSLRTSRAEEYTVLLLRLLAIPRNKKWPVTDMQWHKFDKLAGEGYLDPFQLTFKSKSVQFMEMGFYYYGDYAMLRFLVACLGMDHREGFEDFTELCTTHHGETFLALEEKEMLRIYTDALTILSKAVRNHALIRTYCRYMLAHEDLSFPLRKKLDRMLHHPSKG